LFAQEGPQNLVLFEGFRGYLGDGFEGPGGWFWESWENVLGIPRKTLKKLFQELDIPPWQRTAKILCIEQEVLAVAGVGLNIDLMTQYGPRVLPTFILDNTH
jgi:tRNA(Ile)-lysidine synthetase-like protein